MCLHILGPSSITCHFQYCLIELTLHFRGLSEEHEREWQEKEREREMRRKEAEKAKQEVETRRRIEARLRAKQEAELRAKREAMERGMLLTGCRQALYSVCCSVGSNKWKAGRKTPVGVGNSTGKTYACTCMSGDVTQINVGSFFVDSSSITCHLHHYPQRSVAHPPLPAILPLAYSTCAT